MAPKPGITPNRGSPQTKDHPVVAEFLDQAHTGDKETITEPHSNIESFWL